MDKEGTIERESILLSDSTTAELVITGEAGLQCLLNIVRAAWLRDEDVTLEAKRVVFKSKDI